MKEYIIELSDNENALSILVKAYNLHELIRCKDCKLQECEGRNGMIVCDITGESHKPDWFCADGDRK